MKTRIQKHKTDNQKENSYSFKKNIFLWLFTAVWFIILLIYFITLTIWVLYILFAYSIFLALNIFWIILLSELRKKNLKLNKKMHRDNIKMLLKDRNFLNNHNYHKWIHNKKILESQVNNNTVKASIIHAIIVPAIIMYMISTDKNGALSVWQTLWLYSFLSVIILLWYLIKYISCKNNIYKLKSYQMKWQCAYFTKYWDKIFFY